MTVTLRPESPQDAAFIRRLILETVTLELGAAEWPEPMRSHLMEIQCDGRRKSPSVNFPGATNSVIQADGADAGWVVVAVMPGEVYLAEIMILPELRGTGIGTAVLKTVLDTARQAGIPVRLTVNTTNHAAIRLYERLGFRRTERGAASAVQHLMEWSPLPGISTRD
jgi:ribosomal protein S18 acetylase RimI-like enzyme